VPNLANSFLFSPTQNDVQCHNDENLTFISSQQQSMETEERRESGLDQEIWMFVVGRGLILCKTRNKSFLF
jgi:hypothetical protein